MGWTLAPAMKMTGLSLNLEPHLSITHMAHASHSLHLHAQGRQISSKLCHPGLTTYSAHNGDLDKVVLAQPTKLMIWHGIEACRHWSKMPDS